MVRSDDMLWTSDIARGVGIAESTVRAYKSRGQMPKPTGHLGRIPYWSRTDLGPWLKARGATVTHSAYLCHQPLSDRARFFFFHCETCMAGSPDLAIKKAATKLCKAHAADPVATRWTP